VATTFKELKRRVFIGFPRVDGEAVLAVGQAINDSIKIISSLEEIGAQLVTDTTSADTVASQKTYHVNTDFNLTRPQDIHGIRLIDGSSSVDLIWVPHKEVDRKIPYPEINSTGRSKWYTTFGDYIEMFPIPDTAYNLTIRYSQWPNVLSSDTDESPFGTEWDHVLVFMSKDIANAYLNGDYNSAESRAYQFLNVARKATKNPNNTFFARPFNQWYRRP
jgi:hypothetical protein